MVTMKGAQAQAAVVTTSTATKSRPFPGPDAPYYWTVPSAITANATTNVPSDASTGDGIICTAAANIAAKRTQFIVDSSGKAQYYVDA